MFRSLAAQSGRAAATRAMKKSLIARDAITARRRFPETRGRASRSETVEGDTALMRYRSVYRAPADPRLLRVGQRRLLNPPVHVVRELLSAQEHDRALSGHRVHARLTAGLNGSPADRAFSRASMEPDLFHPGFRAFTHHLRGRARRGHGHR